MTFFESLSRSNYLVEHDLFPKTASHPRVKPKDRPFRDHALLFIDVEQKTSTRRSNFRHKLRNARQVFAPNHEAKKPCVEIALKQGWGKHTLEANKNGRSNRGSGS
jgi:hypothetical protein